MNLKNLNTGDRWTDAEGTTYEVINVEKNENDQVIAVESISIPA